MSITGDLPEFSLLLLNRLEQRELRLLSWGCVDGVLTEEEVVAEAEELLAKLEAEERPGGDGEETRLESPGLLDPWDDVVQPLVDHGWLCEVWGRNNALRTRMAEGVRLLQRLRQIRPWGGEKETAWRNAPGLVADYRIDVRQRLFPRRTLDLSDIVKSELSGLDWTPPDSSIRDTLLAAILSGGDGQPLKVSGFQARAAIRILDAAHSASRTTTGTIICAGTGSGKTLAFYVPALVEIARCIDASSWVKCLAVYPRNELLKDQLVEAIRNARRLSDPLRRMSRRNLVIGALIAGVPWTARSLESSKTKWKPVTVHQKGPGMVCPFVRCPVCNSDLAWLDSDRQGERESLVCCSHDCSGYIDGAELPLTRRRLLASPPDILFTSTEMLNQRMSSQTYAPLLGLASPSRKRPLFVLLDEVHTYEGTHGAHVAYLLRRWRQQAKSRTHFVGLSATLEDAPRFFGELVGLSATSIACIEPKDDEMEAVGAEYQVVLRGDHTSGAGLLSTSLQTSMLTRRLLGVSPKDHVAGSRLFCFTDNLDVTNRFYYNLLDAEGRAANGAKRRPTLASLRASIMSSADARDSVGQNWHLLEQIGHDLSDSLRIARTSSQDQGVDSDSDVVVASPSLEVGFDDDRVGAVLQHKAPPSDAQFLQRKGRGGRKRTMRPWTVMVLSNFGRDRRAFQAFERIFSPILSARHLPLSNRAIERMQAGYVLLSWLAQRTRGSRLEPWQDLSGPKTSSEVRERQREYAATLRDLLQSDDQRQQFSEYVGRALHLNEDEVQAVLWESPRPVLLGAIPTLLRRLETNWGRATESGAEPRNKYGPPIPDFLQRSLFGDLLTPDVSIIRKDSSEEEAEGSSLLGELPLTQAISAFSPGRVSRRYGVSSDIDYWVNPGDSAVQCIDEFCASDDREFFGYRGTGKGPRGQVACFRPYRILVEEPPDEVHESSNAFPEWQCELRPAGGTPQFVEIPSLSRWSDLLRAFCFHTHHLGCPVELSRYAIGSRTFVKRGRSAATEKVVRFTCPEEGGGAMPAALGYNGEVDAIRVDYVVPSQLHAKAQSDPELLRSLRNSRFLHLFQVDSRLDGKLNFFERQQLAQAFLATCTIVASRRGIGIEKAVSLVAEDSQELIRTIELLALWTAGEEEREEEEARNSVGRRQPRRVAELVSICSDSSVLGVLEEAASCLWENPSSSWEDWLQERFQATLAAAIHGALAALCPRISSESLVVEMLDRRYDGEVTCFWLCEETLGGSGAVETIYEKLTREPRRFVRILDSELSSGEHETVGQGLERILSLVSSDRNGEVACAMERVRATDNHSELLEAVGQLRSALSSNSIPPDRSLMVSVFARLLRSGTSAETDLHIHNVVESWRSLEHELGVEILADTMAAIASDDQSLESSLGMVFDANDEDGQRTWRYSVIRSILWTRGGQLRESSLVVNNRYAHPPLCDRLLVRCSHATSPDHIDVLSSDWFAEMSLTLSAKGECTLVANMESETRLVEALKCVSTTPLDHESLSVHARLTGLGRDSDAVYAKLELPEAFL